MPVITIEALKPTQEQKDQLMKEFTESASRILNVPPQFFYVIVKENEMSNFGVNGHTIDKFFAELQAAKEEK